MLNLFEFVAKKNKQSEKYQFWTHENYAEVVYSNKFIDQKINYIHENPVRASLVQHPEEYLYSSAGIYSGKSSVLEVIPVECEVEKTPCMRFIR